MRLDELQNALNNNPLTIKNGRVCVQLESLDKNFSGEVLAPFCDEPGISILAGWQVEESGAKKAVINGNASFPSLTSPADNTRTPLLEGTTETQATFEIVGEGAEAQLRVTLRYQLPKGWRFLKSFPELPLPFDYTRARYDSESSKSSLDATFALTNEHHYFYLTTHEHDQIAEDDASVSLKAGLNFVGRSDPGGMLGLFAYLASDGSRKLRLHGQVILTAATGDPILSARELRRNTSSAGIHLEAPLGLEVFFPPGSDSIKFTNLRFALYSPLSEHWFPDEPANQPVMAYLGDLVIPAIRPTRLLTVSAVTSPGKQDELAFNCQFADFDNDTLLRASGALAGEEIRGSAELASNDLKRHIPSAIKSVIDKLRPQSASIRLARPEPNLSYEVVSTHLAVGVVEESRRWEPFPGLMTISFESLSFDVIRPFDSAKRSVLATFSGIVAFAGVALAVTVEAELTLTTPRLYFSAEQVGTATFDLQNHFGNKSDLRWPGFLPPPIVLSDMKLAADPGAYYAFSMSMGAYKVRGSGTAAQEYSFPTLRLSVSCDTSGTKPRWAWKFEASSESGAGVPVVDLIAQSAREVGIVIPQLPGAIKGLTVDSLTLSYNSTRSNFVFECRGTVPLDGGETLECTFTVDKKDGVSPDFGGEILLSRQGKEPLYFGLQFGPASTNDSDRVLAFSGRLASGLSLSDIVSEIAGTLGVTLPPSGIPNALNPALTSLNGYLEITTRDLVLSAETLSGTTLVVAVIGSGDNKKYAFLIDKKLHLGLSSLPLVGDRIAEASGKLLGVEDVGIENLQAILTYGLTDYATDAVKLNGLIDDAGARFEDGGTLPHLPKTDSAGLQASGFKIHLSATYFFTDKPQVPIPFPFEDAPKKAQGAPTSVTAPAEEPPGPQSQATWLDVQRSFGPVSVKRLGITCEQGKVWFLLDASLVVSGLTMGLQGLSLGFPIETLITFDRKQFLDYLRRNKERMSTKLDGLSVTYESGPIAISGGLLKVGATGQIKYAYNGELLMKADTWALSVYGSFAQLENGDSSLFAYGLLNATLGGPSFFFITGIAAGFGYNRNLTLPTLNELPAFPLIAASDTGDRDKLTRDIGRYVYPASGQNWLAVGVRFTSFKVIKSFALLTFSFGNRFEIALLGLSEITMPFGAKKPIAYAKLALEVKFAPEDGVLKIAAQLTPDSYILDKNCHLNGGFALYTWFKGSPKDGVEAGDFVLSIGGYHPNFSPPAGYPIVPRVAANWRVNDELTIKGGFYFALTPNAIMAGGTLQANYESGKFKAWFDARVDFLLLWEPFYYEAHSKLSLGVSYTIDNWLMTKTITCQVGVDLTLQGPPFGGKAVVDLYVCSFTLNFGTPDKAPKPLSWDDFKKRFLPPVRKDDTYQPGPTDSYCYSRATSGLVKELPANSPVDWIVNPETFVIVTVSAVPCSEAHLINEAETRQLTCDNAKFGLKPCNIPNGILKSTHWIEWKKEANGGPVEWETPEATKNRLPRAAWYLDKALPGPQSLELLKEPRVTDELTTGFKLVPKPGKPQGTVQIKINLLECRSFSYPKCSPPLPPNCDFAWTTPEIPLNPLDQSVAKPLSKVNEPQIKSRRNHIASALKRQDIVVTQNTAPKYLETVDDDGLLAAPVLCELGR